MKQEVRIRAAEKADMAAVVALVAKLADYEKLPHEAVATAELFEKYGFGNNPYFHCLLAENAAGRTIGFALFFYKFSTFTGTPTLHLEDLFVDISERGKGIGLSLLCELAGIARTKECARMEWSVLDWNEPAIDFYQALGARPLDGWTLFRLTPENIDKLANLERKL